MTLFEEWRPVKGYEGLYEVSNTGRVASLDYNHTKKRKELVLANWGGYKTIGLHKGGTQKNAMVHRLVAEAFIPNPNDLPRINHINENKSDNRAENLEWCTVLYNNTYGTRLKRVAAALGIPVRQMTLDGVEVARYPSLTAACRTNGYSIGHINGVCKGRKGCKTAYGYKWEYIKEGDINGE